jgi:hypothetical protein
MQDVRRDRTTRIEIDTEVRDQPAPHRARESHREQHEIRLDHEF